MFLADPGIVERIVLVIIFDDRAGQRGALLDAQRLDMEPAATLRTTTSSGMISTSLMSCSRMLSRRTKWVGTPMPASWVMRYSLMRLLRTPLPSITAFLVASKAVVSSLKYWMTVPGSVPS